MAEGSQGQKVSKTSTQGHGTCILGSMKPTAPGPSNIFGKSKTTTSSSTGAFGPKLATKKQFTSKQASLDNALTRNQEAHKRRITFRPASRPDDVAVRSANVIVLSTAGSGPQCRTCEHRSCPLTHLNVARASTAPVRSHTDVPPHAHSSDLVPAATLSHTSWSCVYWITTPSPGATLVCIAR